MNWQVVLALLVLFAGGCEWTYTSAVQLDEDQVRPFLSNLEEELNLGLDIESLTTFVEIVPANETVMRRIDVCSDMECRTIRFVVAMDPSESPTLTFRTYSRILAEKLDAHISMSPYASHEAT